MHIPYHVIKFNNFEKFSIELMLGQHSFQHLKLNFSNFWHMLDLNINNLCKGLFYFIFLDDHDMS
jgi:hypothetical protein